MTADDDRSLPGDELLPIDATCITRSITIAAAADRIWPWLVQMGHRRAGWYSRDALDGDGRSSARAVIDELQHVAPGDRWPIASLPGGLTVLRVEAGHAIVLGGGRNLAFDEPLDFFAALPARYWRATWAFVLVPIDDAHTRLIARVRVDYAPLTVGVRLLWMRWVHVFMQQKQLDNLRCRVEGTLPHHEDRVGDVIDGVLGAARMVIAFATPMLRDRRSRWGLSRAVASRRYPGDEIIASPRWGWTHGVEIAASPSEVWPWIAQLGRDKGGFYSYQFLENLAGCDVQNADRIIAAWQHPEVGDRIALHPRAPGLPVVAMEPGRWMLAHVQDDPHVRVTWLFWLEALDEGRRTRLVSRYRVATSDDAATRMKFGAIFGEPVGTTMDRRMLLGIKHRAEQKLVAPSPAA
ncbi:MAG TPA: hypothetical protein VG755_18075 [Nannocystaceae bacterium]|nr:hypothetical protein [Nannocystaceae bacterium]